ncbi:unnamed protein product (macronuclear) [Paramecium tetraurelia]|uniref:Very-long-chain 3-oxoacyl-CoA synthase n=1 Tax=Paramecium tetraurelia TaxID=5888 RepID=A0EBA3_PARTE|nr:uncharacterized protein GSPATT00025304001 [Paramecium tetraurelia]CAK92570.1 unnamed protein product [Paramecium tetraurelia]|eukprot:XP_001459967.1 hypothetical protein (macronuclear) [Paramecium tetraurelia strain d4-2]
MNYCFRTIDLALFLLIIQLLGHLFIHWNQYNCDMYGNIQACFWIFNVLLRSILQHQQFNKWALFITFLIAGETVSMNVIAVQEKECSQKPTFIFYCILGYILTISSFSKMLRVNKKAEITKIDDSSSL